MSTTMGIESLERRALFAAPSALDSHYAFGEQAVADRLGHGFMFFQAVPAPGDRTYVLAAKPSGNSRKSPANLTIVAINADGKLDTGFGDGGIAVTGRIAQPHDVYQSPGILKVDAVGRLYFADDSRVLRFRPNGSIDRTFGRNGAITYSDPSQPAALSDITPTDDGVLIATTSSTRGVESFSVIKTDGRTVDTTWTTTHDSGLQSYEYDGTRDGDNSSVDGNYQQLHTDQMQFVRSRYGLVLVRIESDKEVYDPHDPDLNGGGRIVGTTRQDLIVTRFHSDGIGKDLTRRELKRADAHATTNLGVDSDTGTGLPQQAAVLSPGGGTLVVQSSQEILKFLLNSGSRDYAHRYSLPGSDDYLPFGERPQSFNRPIYRLLPDGLVYVSDQPVQRNGVFHSNVSRYSLDRIQDRTFADDGVLTIRQRDFTAGDNEDLAELFLGASGRFYFLAGSDLRATAANGAYSHPTLTVRRV